jgi:dihydrofolate reductase
MRRLALRISVSMDGFIEGPNGESDWMAKTRSPAGAAWVAEKIGQAGAHLLGRKAFSELASFWPSANGPLADAMNSVPKIVFSKKGFEPSKIGDGQTPAAKSWSEPLVLTDDLALEIAELKRQPGKILVAHGGVSFAQNLIQTGLIDEFWLAIHPIALGRGQHLFSELKTPLDLKLVSTTSFDVGSIANVYRVER